MKKCPYNRKPCMEHDCHLWQQFRGMNPVTGQHEDKWECVHVMTPILLIENARQLRSVASAAESSRNVVAEKLDSMELHAIGE